MGAEVISIPDRGPLDIRVARALLNVCRTQGVSIWHGHDYKSNVLGLFLSRFVPLKLVTTVHGWVDKSGRMPLYEKIDRWSLRHYERIICVSEDLVQQCIDSGVDASRIDLIRNAIDLEKYHPVDDKSSAKTSWGFPPESMLIGAVGRLSAEKGFRALIEVTSRLIKRGHDIHLAIAGDGPQRQELQQLVQRQPSPERFRLLGHLQDVQRFYAACDVFALTSIREGLPNVVLEAMAMRLPVVATQVADVPYIVEDGHNGLLVPPGHAAALAAGLRRLLCDGSLRTQLAEAAYHTVQLKFSFAERMRKVVGVYEQLLSERHRKSA